MRDVTTLATQYAAFMPPQVLKQAQRASAAVGDERAQLDAYFAVLDRHARRVMRHERRELFASACRVVRSRSIRRPASARARRTRAVRAAARVAATGDPDGDPEASRERLASRDSRRAYRCEPGVCS